MSPYYVANNQQLSNVNSVKVSNLSELIKTISNNHCSRTSDVNDAITILQTADTTSLSANVFVSPSAEDYLGLVTKECINTVNLAPNSFTKRIFHCRNKKNENLSFELLEFGHLTSLPDSTAIALYKGEGLSLLLRSEELSIRHLEIQSLAKGKQPSIVCFRIENLEIDPKSILEKLHQLETWCVTREIDFQKQEVIVKLIIDSFDASYLSDSSTFKTKFNQLRSAADQLGYKYSLLLGINPINIKNALDCGLWVATPVATEDMAINEVTLGKVERENLATICSRVFSNNKPLSGKQLIDIFKDDSINEKSNQPNLNRLHLLDYLNGNFNGKTNLDFRDSDLLELNSFKLLKTEGFQRTGIHFEAFWKQVETVAISLKNQDQDVIGSVKNICANETKVNLSEDSFRHKYDNNKYVERVNAKKALNKFLEDPMPSENLPFRIIVAGSGTGKTCLIRNLLDEYALKKDAIPVLIRGINDESGNSQKFYIETFLNQLFSMTASIILVEKNTDKETHAGIVLKWLATRGIRLVILFDGVNEAPHPNETLNSCFDLVKLLFRLFGAEAPLFVITTRPEVLANWKARTEVHRDIRIDETYQIELARFDADELKIALENYKLENIPESLKALASDPLLIDFISKLGGEKLKDIKVFPSEFNIINAHLEELLRKIGEESRTSEVELGQLITKICKEMISKADSRFSITLIPDKLIKFVTNDHLLFERTSLIEDGDAFRFRYDRLAQLAIAKYAILSTDGDYNLEKSELIKWSSMLQISDAIESDVILQGVISSFETALRLSCGSGQTPTQDYTKKLLIAYLSCLENEECDRAINRKERHIAIKANRQRLSEIISQAFLEGAKAYPETVSCALSAIINTSSETTVRSLGALTLKRTVFGILRDRCLAEDGHIDSGLLEAAAKSLLEEPVGDPQVLLHAIHQSSEMGRQTVYKIISAALNQSTVHKSFLGAIPRLISAYKILIAIMMIGPESLVDKEYTALAKNLYKKLPDGVIAFSASMATTVMLNSNSMPVRENEWVSLTTSSDENNLANVTKMLLSSSWKEKENNLSHIEQQLEYTIRQALTARNAFVTQMATHAISCAFINLESKKREELQMLMKERCEKLSLILSNNASALSNIDNAGLEGYLLSLVYYHLIAFSIDKLGSQKQIKSLLNDMFSLAETLLSKPLLGRFSHVSPQLETSNIIGTLGRCVDVYNKKFKSTDQAKLFVKNFQDLVDRCCQDFTQEESVVSNANDWSKVLSMRNPGNKEFVVEALSTLGTLCNDPRLALDCLYEFGMQMRIPNLKSDSKPKGVKASLKEIDLFFGEKGLQAVRAVHPFDVESFIARANPRKAVENLRRARGDRSVNVSRHFSWLFEHSIEKCVLQYPDAVESIKKDTFNNLTGTGLRKVAALTMLRLASWARDKSQAEDETLIQQRASRYAKATSIFFPIIVAVNGLGTAYKRSILAVKP